MRKALTAFIAASAVAFTVVFAPLATPTYAASCDDVKFIFARGSGQPLNDKEYTTYRSEIISELKIRNSSLKYSFYELGSSYHGGARYPATALNFFNILGAKISAGTASSYGKSVKQGLAELKAYITEISSTCKNTKFVLAGFSQGAQIITTAIPDLDANKIIYAATFGDPKLYLPEGKGVFPDACIGKNLSSYREYAPNCFTSAGSLGEKNPYQPSGWLGKIGLWCKDKDLVCGAGVKISDGEGDNLFAKLISGALSSHTSYPEDGIFVLSAKTIASKLQAAFPEKIQKVSSSTLNRDTVILIDHTASMYPHISQYKKEALRLAKSTINGGGRIALYTYGDLNEEKAQRLVDFGDSIEDFQLALDNITTRGGGDAPESMLSALLTVINNQFWRAGATKSIVVLTDAGYHNPDRDGTTLEAVTKRSLEIDPVNTYIVSAATSHTNQFELVTSSTSGRYFNSFDNFSTDYLLARPNLYFPINEYSGTPGQTFNFNLISDSDDIMSYEWDLDFDGIFETSTNLPSVSRAYTSNATGFIQARIKNASGSYSTASAKIKISENTAEQAAISNLSVTVNGNSAQVSYQFNNSTIATMVKINDVNLGFTDQTNFTISDLTEPVTLTLTPFSKNGIPSNSTSLKIAIPSSSDDITDTNNTPVNTTNTDDTTSTTNTANTTDTTNEAISDNRENKIKETTPEKTSPLDGSTVVPLVPNSGQK